MTDSRVLVVGPRQLPASGTVEVWADAGSGASGQRIAVPVTDLQVAEMDNGAGSYAIYLLRYHYRGDGALQPLSGSGGPVDAATAGHCPRGDIGVDSGDTSDIPPDAHGDLPRAAEQTTSGLHVLGEDRLHPAMVTVHFDQVNVTVRG